MDYGGGSQHRQLPVVAIELHRRLGVVGVAGDHHHARNIGQHIGDLVEMIRVYLGQDFPQIATDIRILTIVIVVGGLNYLFGIVGLVNIGLEKQFTIFVFIAGLINILISTLLAKCLGDMGSSIALSSAECVLFILVIIQFNFEKDKSTRAFGLEDITKKTI